MTTEYHTLVNQQPQFEVSSIDEWHQKIAASSGTKEQATFFEIIWVREGFGKISIDLTTHSLFSNRRVTGHPASFHIHQIIVLEAKRRALHYGTQLKSS